MRRLSSKLVLIEMGDGHSTGNGRGHWCPACGQLHVFAVGEPFANGAKWTFDGDLYRPTFAPSMNIGWGSAIDPRFKSGGRCHYFLTKGQIQYLGDCTHAMRGQTVDLPDLPSRYHMGHRPEHEPDRRPPADHVGTEAAPGGG